MPPTIEDLANPDVAIERYQKRGLPTSRDPLKTLLEIREKRTKDLVLREEEEQQKKREVQQAEEEQLARKSLGDDDGERPSGGGGRK